MIISNRAKKIKNSPTLSISAKAKKIASEGNYVISFSVGEPDFDTPNNIKEAAIESLKKGYTKYTQVSGIVELKKEICNKLKKYNDLEYHIDNIIVSNGAKQCLDNVFGALLNEGDEVIFANPFWVTYPEIISYYGGIPVQADCKASESFKLTYDNIKEKITKNTKIILLNSPNNPVGYVYSKEELIKIGKIAKEEDLIIISDEIYEMLIYDDKKSISIASIDEDLFKRTIVINGLSKSYAMTGWRIGYAAGDKELIAAMGRIQSHTTSNVNTMTQYAALEGFKNGKEIVKLMVKEFEKRKNFMKKKLKEIELLSSIEPEGAFYTFVDISRIIEKSYNGVKINSDIVFCEILLEEFYVATVPGSAFGKENWIRISYARSEDEIEKGMNLIKNFINQLK